MKKAMFLAVCVTLIAAAPALCLSVPSLINYQGVLTDANGNLITGTLTKPMIFAVYDAANGGVMKWGPENQTVQIVNGQFNVLLGSVLTNPAITTAFDGPNRYLSIKVDGVELLPRQQVLSTGYAVQAERAVHAALADNATNAVNAASAAKADTVQGTKAQLDANGNFIRKIARATGIGPIDDTDSGQIKSRVLTFNKIKSDTAVRIGYTDNIRVMNGGFSCRREIRVDGVSCPGGAIFYDFYGAPTNINNHRSQQVVGYCQGIASGVHEIQIWSGPVPGYSQGDCMTGWQGSTWVIEAEEVY